MSGRLRRVAALGLFAAGCGGGPADDRVPEYGAVTLAGDTVALADLHGDVVLLNVWATWCAPCREEIPVLQEIHEQRAHEGVRVIGVSVDDATARGHIRRFAAEIGMTYDIWLDPGEHVSSAFLLHGIPSTILFDRLGRERWRKVGPIEPADPALALALEEVLTDTR